jgi:hypothetical protein
MNTQEARSDLRDMADEAQVILIKVIERGSVRAPERQSLRRLALEARELLPDAGYPGDGVWRTIQRASISAETLIDEFDHDFWQALEDDLRAARDTLHALISPDYARETDVHFVD